MYTEFIKKYASSLEQEKSKSIRIGSLRLLMALLVLISSYSYFKYDYSYALVGALIGVSLFFYFIKKHNAIKNKIIRYQSLISINQKEIKALQKDFSSFDTGIEYIQTEHPYTHDLDIFGKHSLFQYINRSCTAIGKNKLAELFQKQETENIILNQEAVKELAPKMEWRQNFMAIGQLCKDDKDSVLNIKQWVNSSSYFQTNKTYRILGYTLPSILFICGIAYLFTDQDFFYQTGMIIFLVNLCLFGFLLKYIKKDYQLLSNGSKKLFMYSQLIATIEQESFSSQKLRNYQQILSLSNTKAHDALKQLSGIIFRIESMNYGLPAIFSNGLLLYNIHSIYALEEWKQRYGKNLESWLEVISSIDALNSIANFSYNNAEFIFPDLSEQDHLITKEMGHPLIDKSNRVCNSINFTDQKFVILTGSNMSGKSTFLRTLGLNLILAKMGAPVCAQQFTFYPYEIFLSMRINDSLQNNESFFFAELKRLQLLIQKLSSSNKTFIMLDEILRGTNSNDKYTGTIGLIKKLVSKNATGIIATHDLSVTQLTEDYPNYLSNKCFEVEIKSDELYFDYKLKDGVCEKMSASFLMKKMKII